MVEPGWKTIRPVSPRRGRQQRTPGERVAGDERRIVTAAVVAAACAFVPTAVVASVVAGAAGFFGAVVGTSLVLVLFGVGAAMMLWAGRRGPSALTMVAAGGVGARLMIYAAVLMALDAADVVHRPSLAAATFVTLVITLAAELAVLARTPSLFHLNVGETAASGRPGQPRFQRDRSTTQ